MTTTAPDLNPTSGRHLVRTALLISIFSLALSLSAVVFAPLAKADPRGAPPAVESLPTYLPHGRPSTFTSIGDSYTAGLGIKDKVGSGSNPWASLYCGQSTNNFPRLVGADFGTRYPGPPVTVKDASCKSVTTDQLLAPDPTTGNQPQLDAVAADDPLTPTVDETTDLVTISLGINDIGLIGHMNRCAKYMEDLTKTPPATNQPCKDLDTNNYYFPSQATIDALADEVAWNIADVRTKAPGARILVVGYQPVMPTITLAEAELQPVPTYLCPDATVKGVTRNTLKIRSGDMAEYRRLEVELNNILRDQAVRYGGVFPVDRGVRFVDILGEQYSAGHDVCKPQGTRWIEPRFGYDGASSIAMHPNAAGHQNARRVIQHFIPKSIW
ncbi:MAG: SGNH/GDSL hydrolase family protein [Thermoleophilaceae bacterium]|nr:SGNH/GDSL hydrolase family protein [Thermoleophilaceae bacterium]